MIATKIKGTVPIPQGCYRGTMSGYEVMIPCKDSKILTIETHEGVRGRNIPCYVIIGNYQTGFVVTEK